MLKTLSKKEIKSSRLHLKAISSSIALVLSLMLRICSVSQDSEEVDYQLMKTTAVETMHDFLNTWIKRVIGSVFGGASNFWEKTTISSRLNKETKVCDNYLLMSNNDMYILLSYTAVAGFVGNDVSFTS